MSEERCISACQEKDRLGIRHGWCWVCVQGLRRKWRDEDNEHAKDLVQMAREIAEMRSQRDELRRLAKEATNRWALLYARTEKEHREVSRLHRDIDAVTTSKAEPAPMWGGYPLTWGDEE